MVKRSVHNPVLEPDPSHSWEASAVLNGCPVERDGQIYLVYRALSLPHYHSLARAKTVVSDIGVARGQDGIHFGERRRFIVPQEEWEKFGCEDPRVTQIDDKYYIFYTALSGYPFNAENIKVAVAVSRNLQTVEEKHLVTPFNAKAMALFPARVGGRLWAVLTVHTDRPPAKICLAAFDRESDLWSPDYWKQWYGNFEKFSLPLSRRPQDHIEVGAPPLQTKHGWLLLYSYIRDYSLPTPVFGIEAVLLDKDNPLKIIARTEAPILTPEEYYERIGMVPRVVFPSGALLHGDWIYLYYGAADTTCCLAFVSLSALMGLMLAKDEPAPLKRAQANPVLVADPSHPWEARATFNPAALDLDGRVHLLYRAMSPDNTSVFGYASSADGINFDDRGDEPVYGPRERFETKLKPGGNSGCEDARLTRIGDTIYMCYTAYDGKNPPRVALTTISVADFLRQSWNWTKPVLISPPGMDDKDAFIFPEKIGGKFMIVHRSGDSIDYAFHPTLDFDHDEWLEEYLWIAPRVGWWDSRKVGAAAPPAKTRAGWLMLYHGVSDNNIYRVGAVLLDGQNPAKVIARSARPIMEPDTDYEKVGQVGNVVFPCGMVLRGDTLFVYYGAADSVVGVATVRVETLLSNLTATMVRAPESA